MFNQLTFIKNFILKTSNNYSETWEMWGMSDGKKEQEHYITVSPAVEKK